MRHVNFEDFNQPNMRHLSNCDKFSLDRRNCLQLWLICQFCYTLFFLRSPLQCQVLTPWARSFEKVKSQWIWLEISLDESTYRRWVICIRLIFTCDQGRSNIFILKKEEAKSKVKLNPYRMPYFVNIRNVWKHQLTLEYMVHNSLQ